jgi:hypothetical protein
MSSEMTLREFQANQKRTSPPATPEMVNRLAASRERVTDYLDDMQASAVYLDKLKKFIFYGKASANGTEVAFAARRAEWLTVRDSVTELERDTLRLMHSLIGVVTEAAELWEAIEPALYELKAGHRDSPTAEVLDLVNVDEELFDIMWYASEGATDLTEVAERGFGKLRQRYPEKFDAESAVNRDLTAEREALES